MVKQFVSLFALTSVWSSKSISVFSNRDVVSVHGSVRDPPICCTVVPWKLVWYSPAACNFWDYLCYSDIFHKFFFFFFFFLSRFSSTNIHDLQELRLLQKAHLCTPLEATLEPETMVSMCKSVTTKLHKKPISQFTSWNMFKQFHYLTTNFHERFGSFTYFLGQKVKTVMAIAKVIKCLS